MSKEQQKNKEQIQVYPEKFITVKEAAAFLAIPDNTCYRLCLKRVLPSYKTGNFRRLKLSEVSEYMERGRVKRSDQ